VAIVMNNIRVQILGKDTFPPLNEVLSYLQEEEDRLHALLSASLVGKISIYFLLST